MILQSEEDLRRQLYTRFFAMIGIGVFFVVVFLFFGPKVGAIFGLISKHRNDPIVIYQAALTPPRFVGLKKATNKEIVTVKGFARPQAEVKIYVNGPERGASVANLDGEFIIENVKLIPGRNTIYGKTFQDGKESEKSDTVYIVLDTKKPDLDVESPKDGETIRNLNNRILIKGKVNEEASIKINERTVIIRPDKTFEYFLGVKEGDVAIKIKATDVAGNETEKEIKVKYEYKGL